jgi:hypothetical protein
MGWQDAPLVEGGTKAAWESAPLVENKPDAPGLVDQAGSVVRMLTPAGLAS